MFKIVYKIHSEMLSKMGYNPEKENEAELEKKIEYELNKDSKIESKVKII